MYHLIIDHVNVGKNRQLATIKELYFIYIRHFKKSCSNNQLQPKILTVRCVWCRVPGAIEVRDCVPLDKTFSFVTQYFISLVSFGFKVNRSPTATPKMSSAEITNQWNKLKFTTNHLRLIDELKMPLFNRTHVKKIVNIDSHVFHVVYLGNCMFMILYTVENEPKSEKKDLTQIRQWARRSFRVNNPYQYPCIKIMATL